MAEEERPALAQLDSEEFDGWAAIGGIRGLVESVAPGIVFLILYITTSNLQVSLIAALALAAVAVVARVVSRTPITQALSGVGGILIGALWAWRTGDAEDFYVWGLLVNAAFAAGTILSNLIRRPIVGFFVQAFAPAATRVPGAGKVFRNATWLWASAFLARIAVQVPLYLNAEVGWLGTARVLMGLPLWALVLWFTWMLVRPVIAASSEQVEALRQPTDEQNLPHDD